MPLYEDNVASMNLYLQKLILSQAGNSGEEPGLDELKGVLARADKLGILIDVLNFKQNITFKNRTIENCSVLRAAYEYEAELFAANEFIPYQGAFILNMLEIGADIDGIFIENKPWLTYFAEQKNYAYVNLLLANGATITDEVVNSPDPELATIVTQALQVWENTLADRTKNAQTLHNALNELLLKKQSNPEMETKHIASDEFFSIYQALPQMLRANVARVYTTLFEEAEDRDPLKNKSNGQVHQLLKRQGLFNGNEALKKSSFKKAHEYSREEYQFFAREVLKGNEACVHKANADHDLNLLGY